MLDKSSVGITRVICDRLRESRELCGLIIDDAAELMRINPKLLWVYETGNYGNYQTCKLPLWFLALAAETYDVSLDYLFGGHENFESNLEACRDRELLTLVNLRYLTEAKATRLELAKQSNRLAVIEAVVGLLPNYLRRITDAFKRYRELNPDTFDDRLGSNTLYQLCTEAVVVAHKANCELVRYHCIDKANIYALPIQKGRVGRV